MPLRTTGTSSKAATAPRLSFFGLSLAGGGAIHAGVEPDPTTGAIMTPIYQTSTYVQASPGDHKGYEYSRTHNPTRTALQNALAALENGTHGLCFATGMASIDAICKLFKPGDEIVSTNDLYGGTYRLFTKIFEGFGLKFRFVDMGDPANVAAAMTPMGPAPVTSTTGCDNMPVPRGLP